MDAGTQNIDMMSWLPSRSANLVDNGDTLDQPRNPKPGTVLAARWKRRDILKSADAAIKPSASYRRQAAMTLIELLITVAVLGILAAIAVPSYLEYVRQARRADAESILMKAVQFLERTYTTRNCYNWGGAACGGAAADVTALLGTDINRAPSGVADADRYYVITVSAVTANTFTLQAAPAGVMTGDVCGNLTLTNTGVKGAADTLKKCWKQ